MFQEPRLPTKSMLDAGEKALSHRRASRATAYAAWFAMDRQRLIDDDAERLAATQARLAANTSWAAPGSPPVRVEPSPATPAAQPRQHAPSVVAGDFGR